LQKACVDVGLSHQKLKTPMKTMFDSKVILFQKNLGILKCHKFVLWEVGNLEAKS
jgi:hypothetical protein